MKKKPEGGYDVKYFLAAAYLLIYILNVFGIYPVFAFNIFFVLVFYVLFFACVFFLKKD